MSVNELPMPRLSIKLFSDRQADTTEIIYLAVSRAVNNFTATKH